MRVVSGLEKDQNNVALSVKTHAKKYNSIT
jgi:hypothetical protein